jgi:hypothetical protein
MSTIRLMLQRNHGTVRLQIPIAFSRRYDLVPGDEVEWREDAEGVHLKFIKVTRQEKVVVGVAA